MQAITRIVSKGFSLPDANIDTDQIIPARFLSTTSKDGLADAAFHDWRFDGDGNRLDVPLNRVDTSTHAVLVGGPNFGSGSSREHAVWALQALGIRAVVTTKAADIFKSNALKNGLVVAEIGVSEHTNLILDPDQDITLDLEAMTVSYGDTVASFTLEPFGRLCLMRGIDQMGYLLEQEKAISAFEANRHDPLAADTLAGAQA